MAVVYEPWENHCGYNESL